MVVTATPDDETTAAAPAPAPPPPEFEKLYRENLGFVVALLRRFGVPPSGLREACQDVFVRVHQTLDQYEPSRPLRGWLHGVAFNVVRESRRAWRKAALHDELPEGAEWGGADPAREAEVREGIAVVRAALAQIDPARREVFEMKHVLGMTAPEISEALGGVSMNTIYARLYAAEEAVNAAVARYQRRS